jgi:hypothetical protein
MRYLASVTLEYSEACPESIQREIEVSNAPLGVRRAVETAFTTYPSRQWTSLVVVLDRCPGRTRNGGADRPLLTPTSPRACSEPVTDRVR